MTRFTVESPKEIARIQKTAKNGAAWDKKRAEYLKSIASDTENALEAANKARRTRALSARVPCQAWRTC
jgi:3-methyladenine DNA glycosylase/8-oxoguanine DNA glycosylase